MVNDYFLIKLYEKKSIEEFWAMAYDGYEKIGELALRTLLPFSPTYVCECSFYTLLNIKNKIEIVLIQSPK